MATKRQHVYAISNILNQGPRSDDSRISNRLIAHFLNMSRGLLLKRRMDRKHSMSDANYLTYCDTLVPSKFFDCDCVPEEFNCLILRSTKVIPDYISSQDGVSIEVRNPFSGELIDYASLSSSKLAKHSLTSSNTPTWFIHNKHLYITHTLTLDKVIIRLIPEDPEALKKYQSCEGSSICYDPEDDNYPIDTDLVQPMYNLTLEMLAKSYQFSQDDENNTKASVINNDKEV